MLPGGLLHSVRLQSGRQRALSNSTAGMRSWYTFVLIFSLRLFYHKPTLIEIVDFSCAILLFFYVPRECDSICRRQIP